ncbi:MAG: hypothetical protein ACI9DF_005991, partial [Verrucomicrobiales bacterium]
TQLRLSYQLSSWFVLCWVSHPAGLCCLTAHECDAAGLLLGIRNFIVSFT